MRHNWHIPQSIEETEAPHAISLFNAHDKHNRKPQKRL
jgi:hypothetical protein